MRKPGQLKRASGLRRIRSACTGLRRDRDGSALIYTTISLPVLIGFALLAIDGARIMNLHSSLQHAADGLALAAAGELDRRPDACDRAERALENLVKNDQRFGDAGAATIEMDDVSWRFLEVLPANDANPIEAWMVVDCDTPADAADVRFIEVTVDPQNFTTLFPATFVGAASNTAQTNATAVAGFKQAVCQFTPLMMCNPLEGQSPSIFEAAESSDYRRRMIELRKVGPSATYFAGNFAFLRSPALGPGADALRDALARTNPGTCFVADGVDTQPGQAMGPVHQGFNVRFDIYDGPMNSRKSNADFRPSMNVRKGHGGTGNACNHSLIDDGVNYQGLPRDQTVQAELGGGRLYSGDWDFEKYWAVNYGHTGLTAPNGWNNTNANRPSRYDVYRYEIDNPLLLTPSYLNRQSVGGEIGAPLCASSTATDDIDRRIIHAAVVNCGEQGPLSGQEDGVPVLTFAKFFLIRPIDGSDSMDVELVGVTEPGLDDEVVRDLVQLYR